MANQRPKPEDFVSPDWFKDWMQNNVVNISNQKVLMRITHSLRAWAELRAKLQKFKKPQP